MNERHPEHQYLDLLAHLRHHGVERGDRTGTGTKGMIGAQIRFDLSGGKLPVLTSKKVFTRGIIEELLWIMRGETNIKPLLDRDVHIWDEWADAKGDLGPVYGRQWRHHEGVNAAGQIVVTDQLAETIALLKRDPNSRRNIIDAWNVSQLRDMALTPCHCLVQFSVLDGKLYTHLFQRSGDILLGVPFNITSYAILCHLMAAVAGLEPGEFIHTFGDLHLYLNHLDAADQQLKQASHGLFPFPTIRLKRVPENVWDFRAEDIEIVGYRSHAAVKAPVAV